MDYKAKKISELAKKILKAKKQYYAGNPTISDQEYDLLEKNLKFLDPEHPILKMVGYDADYKNT